MSAPQHYVLIGDILAPDAGAKKRVNGWLIVTAIWAGVWCAIDIAGFGYLLGWWLT